MYRIRGALRKAHKALRREYGDSMENTETAPLLGPAGHSMYHRSASDNVQLLPIVEPSSAMASPAIDDLSTSQSQDRFSEDSLRRRASSRSSGAGDDFFNIEVCVGCREGGGSYGARHGCPLAD